MNKYIKNSFVYAESHNSFGERYPTGVKSAVLDSSLKHLTCLATIKSCDTMKLSLCGWQFI